MLCDDGVYRWIYEFSMLKNPVLLFTIWKILIMVFGGIGLIVMLASLGDAVRFGDYKSLLDIAIVFIILIAVFLFIGTIAYLILASIYGGKYVVLFEMDNRGVRHLQQEKQFTKAQGVAWLTSFIATAGGDPIRGMGQGLLIASHNEMFTSFEAVRSIRVMRSFNTIKIKERLNRNQIYAEPEDFEFVVDYIRSRIPNSVKKMDA